MKLGEVRDLLMGVNDNPEVFFVADDGTLKPVTRIELSDIGEIIIT